MYDNRDAAKARDGYARVRPTSTHYAQAQKKLNEQ